MGWFGKAKEEKTEKCCCNADTESVTNAQKTQGANASVKVLGSGCRKCNQLEENAKEALLRLGMEPTIEHVTDFGQIASYGVMTTPALVIDGKVVLVGKVASVEEIVALLQKAL
ncbi:thioredoxin family protein [Synergistaceae bacterium OttesenSCG-928-D05]|nr:thioredoxin family protein [Synergistaceae bacterium OttesenSCG-928-D05]